MGLWFSVVVAGRGENTTSCSQGGCVHLGCGYRRRHRGIPRKTEALEVPCLASKPSTSNARHGQILLLQAVQIRPKRACRKSCRAVVVNTYRYPALEHKRAQKTTAPHGAVEFGDR